MRTFIFSDAKSQKFWNIDLQGNQFTVAYGKVGTKGQTQTKTFSDDTKAQKEHDKLIQEKLAKGYVETTLKVKSSKEVLEEAIIQNPKDRAAFAAYADLLIEEGNPQGEFIQIQLALEDESLEIKERQKLQKREKELLKLHERTWLGPLAFLYLDRDGDTNWRKEEFDQCYRYRFVRGVLAELSFYEWTVPHARQLLASIEATRFVHSLEIGTVAPEQPSTEELAGYEPGEDLPEEVEEYPYPILQLYPSLYLLGKWKNLGHLHRFYLGEVFGEMKEEGEIPKFIPEGVNAHDLVEQMPFIEELRLHANRVHFAKLSLLPMPHLRILDLAHTHQYPLKKLAENKTLTQLERLLIHPHGVVRKLPYGLADLKAICRSPNLSSLTHLRMRISLMGDEAIQEIIDSGLIKRLQYLDLLAGCVTDKGAEMLAKCPDAKHLQTLNLRANELTSKGIKKLKALQIPNLDVEEQHHSTADIDKNDFSEMDFLFFYGDTE